MIGTDDMLRNLGKNIRSLRKSKKMTIDQLAEKSFLSGKYLQGVEVGSRNISIKNLNRISKALDTSPEILLNMKTYELKNSDDKIFAISEKLKKFEDNKLDFIGDMLDHLNDIMKEKVENNKKSISNIMPKEYLQVYRILSDQPLHINEIAKNLEKSINEVIPVITMMEIEGYAYQPQTNYFMRNVGAGEIEEQE